MDPSETLQNSLQVVFLVDITGSMGSQIEGVKKMISKFCEIDRPSIDVHIWTYTESPGCHVSPSPKGLKSSDLVAYSQEITLCRPPDKPQLSAGGGDGPENVVAGIAALLEAFQSKDNLLCFIITDAPPHHKAHGNGKETQEEQNWLKERGFENTDIFCILCEVIDTLNITFVPVLYSGSEKNVWHHQAAVMSDGLVLVPKATESEVLANGLGLLLDAFQKISLEKNMDLAKTIDIESIGKGFSILNIDVENFQIFEEDPNEKEKISKDYPKLDNIEDLFKRVLELFETTVDRFKGKKSAKRCRAVNVDHVSKSIKFFLLAMLKVTNSSLFNEEQFTVAKSDLESLLRALEGKDSKYSWELRMFISFTQDIEAIRTRLASHQQYFDETSQPIECMVSLEKVAESLKDLNQIPESEEDLSQWMDLILQLILVRLINLNFPLNASQQPDFTDAWSASVRSLEFASVLSASSALALRGKDDCLYTAPVSLTKYVAALIVTHPNDAQLTEIFRALSFFPTLQGLIQSHLVSGSFKVFPSITFGLQASVLWYLLRNRTQGFLFAQYEWEFIRSLVHSMQASAQVPAPEVFNAAKNGKAFNPVDSIAKVFAALLAYFRRNQVDRDKARTVLCMAFEEYSADVVAFEIRKATNDEGKLVNCNLPSDKELAGCFIDFQEVESFDPLTGIHVSEEFCRKGRHLGDDFLQKVRNKLAQTSEIIKKTVKVFQVYCVLLQCDLKKATPAEALESVTEESFTSLIDEDLLGEVFVESLILKKRTGRYVLKEDNKEWERQSLDRVSVNILHSSLIDTFKDLMKPKMNEWATKRREFCRNLNIEEVKNLEGDSFEEFNAKLSQISAQVADTVLKLSRTDVAQCLEKISEGLGNNQERFNTLGLALIIGDWTKGHPSQLRSQLSRFSACFTEENFKTIQFEMKKEAVCVRSTERPNRHGHDMDHVFPGITNWSQEYEDHIKQSKKKKRGKKFTIHMEELKKYSEYFTEVEQSVLQSANFDQNQKDLVNWCLLGHKDAKNLNKVKKFVERIKLVKMVSSEQGNWDFLTAKLLKKLALVNRPWEVLNRYLESAELVR
jgi:hypothetical protein